MATGGRDESVLHSTVPKVDSKLVLSLGSNTVVRALAKVRTARIIGACIVDIVDFTKSEV